MNELTIFMNTGQVDAALLTLDQIDSSKVDAITIPVNDNAVLITPIGVTTYSQNSDSANKFVVYVASDERKAFFAKHGFPIYPDPVYAGIKP